VYPLKKVNEGVRYLNGNQAIPVSGFEEFERLLLETLREIFDEGKPFVQTEDTDRCRYCAYKEICQR
jgi:CRISPR/Cas system-associated exonuclease Cas4 (RecB family)